MDWAAILFTEKNCTYLFLARDIGLQFKGNQVFIMSTEQRGNFLHRELGIISLDMSNQANIYCILISEFTVCPCVLQLCNTDDMRYYCEW